jgi:hypothetical protein
VSGVELVVLGLGTFRIARLVVEDDITLPVRSWLFDRFPSDWLISLLSCVWCAGFWVSVGVAACWWLFPVVTWWVLLPFGLSAVAGLLAEATE